MKKSSLLLSLCFVFQSCAWLALVHSAEFSWKGTPGIHLDLIYDGRPVARYQYEAIDESTPERREDTFKPYHHIFDFEGKDFITKGPGGKFTHHRGIFYGFSKCSYVDASGKEFKNQDTWHCRKAHLIHRKITQQEAGQDAASMTSEIGWIGDDGFQFATEHRSLTFSFSPAGDLKVKFHSVLTPIAPSVTVDGDPQHAGFHFRALNDVAEKHSKETYYIRPQTGQDAPGKTINWDKTLDTEATRDLPWKVMSFMKEGQRYSVLYIDDPKNPKPARFSERDYGRFGSYFATSLTPAEPLVVNYRLVIRKGEMKPEEIPLHD